MQHHLVNPYIVALNTAMPGESKALEDGYIHQIFERCSKSEAAVKSKANTLKRKIKRFRSYVQSANKQPPDTYTRMRALAYELVHLQESLQHGSGFYQMCYQEIEKYVLGENQAQIERELLEERIAAANARYAAQNGSSQ